MKYCILLTSAILFVVAQAQQYTTPVPILKQINKHNEDGSYSYGYEGADGSFKIETKYPDGEVFGKYGYVDDVGKLREIEYGASRRGFEPQGNGINVPPPTIHKQEINPLGPNEEDDGQYREDPSIYYKDEKYNQPQQASRNYYAPRYTQTQYQQPQTYQQPQAYQQPQTYQQPSYRPSTKFSFDDFISNRQQPQPVYYNPPQPAYYNPPQPAYNQHHYDSFGPAVTHYDLNQGSYSINYR